MIAAALAIWALAAPARIVPAGAAGVVVARWAAARRPEWRRDRVCYLLARPIFRIAVLFIR